jgi:PAS domain S-box-containing protein
MPARRPDEAHSSEGKRAAQGRTAANAALASTEWLRVTLACITDAVITTDAHGRIVFLNAVAQHLTGWNQEAAVSNSLERVFRIVDPQTRQTVENPVALVLRGGVAAGSAEYTLLISKDGTERSIEERAAHVHNAEGEVDGVVLVFRESGERPGQRSLDAETLARAQAILATLPHAFLVLDADMRVESASAPFCLGLQTTEAAIVGRPAFDLGGAQWGIPAFREWLNQIRRGEAAAGVYVLEHEFPANGRRYFRLNAHSLGSGVDEGRDHLLVVMEDVTEGRALQASLHDSEVRYRRLFQTAKDGILILDAETGRIIDANAFMAGLTGQDLPDLVGKELHEIGLFGDVGANKAAFEELRAKGYVRYDHLPIQHRGGSTTEVEFISNVYTEGNRLVAQCNIRDISARVVMEQQILLQTQALADQHRRKDEFLAMLSHELRNPLGPIRSATHLLRLQERGSENLIARQAREVIERQVANLTRLISDLLEVSRIVNARIRLKLETIDLSQSVKHALESAAPLVWRQEHELTTQFPDAADGPVWVSADPTRLEQIIVNLLSNAAKFTAKGGHVHVSFAREHNHAVLRVRDSGIGIAPEMLPHIFDLFAQADRSLERSHGGLGVGLSIVHKLVEMHGGTIEARSGGMGMGSEFTMRLPIAIAPGELTALPSAEHHPTEHKLRVLVVDDNVDGCVMLANLLRMREYGVQMAHTGMEALAVAQSWRPDVVLLDIGLPQLDGYEVARRVRADPALGGIRLVATTGYGNAKDLQLSREAGFDAHLVKPVDLDDIEKLLRKWSEPPRTEASD